MTLNFQNSNVRNFYNGNIAQQAQCVRDAIDLGQRSKALDYLQRLDEHFASLKTIFPTATQDIQSIEKLQIELMGKVEKLETKQVPPKGETSSILNSSKPVGIVRKRGQNNCAYTSVLQGVSSSPNLTERFKAKSSPYSGFYQEYSASQASGKKVSDIDVNDVRKLTSTRSYESEEDAGAELGKMLEHVTPNSEIISFDHGSNLYTKYGQDTLNVQFQSINNFEKEVQDSLKYIGGTPQKSVIVQRTNFDFQGNSISLHSPVPTHIPHKNTGYELTSCVIQLGGTRGGHFVNLQRKADSWYLIDDAMVQKIGPNEAEKLLKKGYLYFYEKSDQKPISTSFTNPHLDLIKEEEPSSAYNTPPSWSLSVIGLILWIGMASIGG